MLVFAGRGRPGGAGEYDLFVSFRCQGKWTEPRPLGAGVNSSGLGFRSALLPGSEDLLLHQQPERLAAAARADDRGTAPAAPVLPGQRAARRVPGAGLGARPALALSSCGEVIPEDVDPPECSERLNATLARAARPMSGSDAHAGRDCMQRKMNGPGVLEGLSRRRLLQLGVAGRGAARAGERGGARRRDGGRGGRRVAGGGHPRCAPGANGERRGDQPVHHPEVPRPHRTAGRADALGSRDQPRRPGPGRGARPGAQGGEGARPAARHPGAAQGQHRHPGPDAHHRRLTGADGRHRPRRRVPGGEAPRGRRGAAREDPAQRVGQPPLLPFVERLERAGRPVPQRLRARPEPVRLELRVGRGGVRQPLRGRRRHRDGWLHRLSVRRLRAGRREAHGGAGEPERHRPHLAQPGHRRADGQDGPGRRGAAGGARGAGSSRRRPPRRRGRRSASGTRPRSTGAR